MKKFLQFKIQVVLMKDISMLTFLLFAEMISVNGCVASYVPSVTVCKKKQKKSGNKYKSFQTLLEISKIFWAFTCCFWIGVKTWASILFGDIGEEGVSFISSVSFCETWVWAAGYSITICKKYQERPSWIHSIIISRVNITSSFVFPSSWLVLGGVSSVEVCVSLCQKLERSIYVNHPKLIVNSNCHWAYTSFVRLGVKTWLSRAGVSSDGSLSICKNYHEGNPEYVLKLPNINLKIQDFFLTMYLLSLTWSINGSFNTLWSYWRRRCLIHFHCFFLRNLTLSSRWLPC